MPMRYINVALVDETGTTSSTQIMTNDPREAADYLESEMAARNGRRNRRNLPLVAAFIFDTDSNTLQQYIIDGLRAKLVTKKMF